MLLSWIKAPHPYQGHTGYASVMIHDLGIVTWGRDCSTLVLRVSAPVSDTMSAPAVAEQNGERWTTRWGRRAASFSVSAALLLVLLASTPLSLPLAVLSDAVRRSRWAATRFLAVALVYLGCELLGLTLGLVVWLPRALGGSRARFVERNFRLQCWWVCTLFEGARRALGVRVEVEGADAVTTGPIYLLVRHVSLADTLLPTRFVSAQVGLQLRFVLKRELLWDPCLDLVGQRLNNAFVRRGGLDTPADVAAVQALTEDLGPTEGVIVFPEGTRFSAERRRRTLERIEARGDHEGLARASALQHVLPPRLGGVLGLLDARADVDVVFCAHRGLSGARTFGDLLSGALVGRTLHIRFWRCPAREIPRDEAGRVAWLHDQWARVDAFVGAA